MNFTGKQKAKEPTSHTFESVTKYMSKDVVSFKTDQPIVEAIDIMLELRISGGPVLDDNGQLVGILSEKDCLKIIVESAYYNQPSQKNIVGNYMSKNVATVDISKDVLEVANLFLSSNFRRYPVIENGQLKGQVSRRDIMKAARELKGTTW